MIGDKLTMEEKKSIKHFFKSIIDAPVDKKNQKVLGWMTVIFTILSIFSFFLIFFDKRQTATNVIFNIIVFLIFVFPAVIIGIEYYKTKFDKNVCKCLYYIQATCMLIFIILTIIIFSPLILLNFIINNKNNPVFKFIAFVIKMTIFVIVFSLVFFVLSKFINKEYYEWRNLIALCIFFIPFFITIVLNAKIFKISLKESLKELTLTFLFITVGLLFYDYVMPTNLSFLKVMYPLTEKIELSKLLNLISFILATVGLWGDVK